VQSPFSCPDRSRGEWRFRLFGVAVRVNFWFWLSTVFLSHARDAATLITWVAVCFFSILVHEFGHVFAFWYFGVESDVVLYGCGGMAIPHWDMRRRLARVVVSLAGPAAGFCVAGLTAAAVWGTGGSVDFVWHFPPAIAAAPAITQSALENQQAWYRTATLINDLLFVNFYWGLINLMPVYPLDGGQAARAIFEHADPYTGRRNSMVLSAAMGMLMAVIGLRSGSLYLTLLFGSLFYSSLRGIEPARPRFVPRPYRSTR
jgi:Zn-dependent protease